MPTLLVPPQHIVHHPFILILDPQQRIRHLQLSDGLAMHAGELPPSVLTFCDSFFEPLQLLRHDMEPMDFGRKRGVIEVTDHSIRLVLAFCPQLELLELFSSVYGLPVIVKDGRGIQWLGKNLAAVVAQPNNERVWVEYDLHILCLLDDPVWSHDRERDEVIPHVWFEPRWDFIASDLVASLI